jgi:hypothetical protein
MSGQGKAIPVVGRGLVPLVHCGRPSRRLVAADVPELVVAVVEGALGQGWVLLSADGCWIRRI